MSSICGEVRLQQLRKAKYSISASILHIFQFFFLTEPYIYLQNILCKSHGLLISCFESGNIFQKMVLENFILSFFFEQDLYYKVYICMGC